LKTRRNAARKYRKLGYSAAELPAAGDMPAFLHRFAPDLVATSEDDKVVLEIKRAADLKGSNEIKELAAVIDRQAGWRFELIALAASPGDIVVPRQAKLERLMARGLALQEAGSGEVAVIFLVSVLEELDPGRRLAARPQSIPGVHEGISTRTRIPRDCRR
jgi:REase_AHJR-like